MAAEHANRAEAAAAAALAGNTVNINSMDTQPVGGIDNKEERNKEEEGRKEDDDDDDKEEKEEKEYDDKEIGGQDDKEKEEEKEEGLIDPQKVSNDGDGTRDAPDRRIQSNGDAGAGAMHTPWRPFLYGDPPPPPPPPPQPVDTASDAQRIPEHEDPPPPPQPADTATAAQIAARKRNGIVWAKGGPPPPPQPVDTASAAQIDQLRRHNSQRHQRPKQFPWNARERDHREEPFNPMNAELA